MSPLQRDCLTLLLQGPKTAADLPGERVAVCAALGGLCGMGLVVEHGRFEVVDCKAAAKALNDERQQQALAAWCGTKAVA